MPWTREDYVEFLRNFRPGWRSYCPICRCLASSRNCRQFNHFGMKYDYELERPVVDEGHPCLRPYVDNQR